MMRLCSLITATVIAVSGLLSGCSDSPTSSNPDTGSVKISVVAVSQAGAGQSLGKGVQSGRATITSAVVVIEKIRFDSTVDDSLDFRFREPFVKDLAAGSNMQVIETVNVPFGIYKKSKIKIDDLDPEDGQVYTDNPELQDRSIVVKGYLDGDTQQTFFYSAEFDEEQEREFNPPLVLDENSPSTNVVLYLNMGMWFVDEQGNFLDPRSSENANVIEDRIKDSIEVFEDKDDDGQRDD